MSYFALVHQGNPALKTSATAWPVRLVSGTDDRAATVDTSTNALNTIDYAHHEIHSGSSYRVIINKDIPNGGTYNVCFTTPNTTKWLHLVLGATFEGEAEVKFYEAVSSWTGGSAITPLNANRNSLNVSGVVDMVFDATITLGSPVTIEHEVVGSGKVIGDSTGGRNEYILKQGTKYAVVCTNQISGGANETNITLDWYEHTDKTS